MSTAEKTSPETSNCPNKELCGSCSWSHIPYSEQLKTKLGEIGKHIADAYGKNICTEIVPSPKVDHYRNRMDFTIDFEGRLGLRQKGKWWRTIDGHHCFISDEQIEEVFRVVQAWLKDCELSYYDRKSFEGLLRYATIRATTTGETLLTILTSEPEETEVEKIKHQLARLAESDKITSLVWGINKTKSDNTETDEQHIIKGNGFIVERVDEYEFIIDPLSFFQSNSHGASVLLNTVLDFGSEFSSKRIVDLYCGSGFFTIPFAKKHKEVIGVEVVPKAIELANQNAERNNIAINFEAAKSEESSWETLKPEVLIVDPPRSGIHPKALKKIVAAKPEAIIYISCNYKEFSKDLRTLKEFYELKKSTAIDMFPHTPHVELVSLLQLK